MAGNPGKRPRPTWGYGPFCDDGDDVPPIPSLRSTYISDNECMILY